MPGVLEINATEYYSNKVEDDIENGIVIEEKKMIITMQYVINMNYYNYSQLIRKGER